MRNQVGAENVWGNAHPLSTNLATFEWRSFNNTTFPLYSIQAAVLCCSTTAENRRKKTANVPRRQWNNRTDQNQNVNLPRPSARQPQQFRRPNICRAAEKRAAWTA